MRLEGRVLRHFWNIFRNDGERRAPSEIDVMAPVQSVADVSRIAQRGQYIRTGFAWSHPGAGEVRDSQTAVDVLQSLNPNYSPEDFDLWLISVGAGLLFTNGQPLGASKLGVRPDVVTGNPNDTQVIPLCLTDGYQAAGPEIIAAQGQVSPWASWDSVGGAAIYAPPIGLPIWIGGRDPLAGIYGVSSATGIVTEVRVVSLWWAGPRGATPPGMG